MLWKCFNHYTEKKKKTNHMDFSPEEEDGGSDSNDQKFFDPWPRVSPVPGGFSSTSAAVTFCASLSPNCLSPNWSSQHQQQLLQQQQQQQQWRGAQEGNEEELLSAVEEEEEADETGTVASVVTRSPRSSFKCRVSTHNAKKKYILMH